MASEEQASTLSPFSDAREQQQNEHINEPTEQLNLWSPPPALFGQEEPLADLPPIDEWTKLIQPTPPSPELQKVKEMVLKLEQSVERLQKEVKKVGKEFKVIKQRNRRKMGWVNRDIDLLDNRLQRISSWGSAVNNVICPILEERLERPIFGVDDSKNIEEFFNKIEDGSWDSDDSD